MTAAYEQLPDGWPGPLDGAADHLVVLAVAEARGCPPKTMRVLDWLRS